MRTSTDRGTVRPEARGVEREMDRGRGEAVGAIGPAAARRRSEPYSSFPGRPDISVPVDPVERLSGRLKMSILQRLAARSLPPNSAVIGASASVPSPVWLRGRRGGAPAAAAPVFSCGGGVVSRPVVSLCPGCACGGCVLVPVCVAGRQACTHGGLLPVWVCCSVKTGAGSSLLERMTGRHRMRRREMLADETKSWDCICCVGGGARV